MMTILCAAAQDPGVTFLLGTADGRTEYQIGEPIPISLDFRVTGSQVFQVSTDMRRRHLRPQRPDEFTATPAGGWADPLAGLRWTMDAMVPSTGSWGAAGLDRAHPVHLKRDLNEFIVFRQPGRYVVRAHSTRVSGLREPLVSNELVLTIAPRDNDWTAHQFAAAKATLEAGKPAKGLAGDFDLDIEQAQVNAVRSLRFLETEPAIRYLASIYCSRGGRIDGEIEFALLASPHLEAVVDQLEREMADPDLTITQGYSSTLVQIKGTLLERKLGRTLTREDWKPLDDAVDQRALEAAESKHPEAKAGTYFYLFQVGSGHLRGSAEVLRRLAALMSTESPAAVECLLALDWDKIGPVRAQLAPFLKQEVQRSRPPFRLYVNGIALRRLLELDPQAGAEAARNELLSGAARIPDAELLKIPLPTSLGLDAALLAQYRQGKPVEARIARFAGAGLESELWRAWESKPGWAAKPPACVSPLFAYFFRVDPATAASRLAELRKGKENACTELKFVGLERQLMSPGMESQLIADAKSGNPMYQKAAFWVLYAGGSPAALPALLDAVEGVQEFRQTMIANLLYGQVDGQGWKLSEADYDRLASLCSGTTLCPDVERARRESHTH